ncbi:MAG: DUF1569 domain-containing protein [Bacteroidota bacterium]
MENILNKPTADSILARIEKLNSGTNALWGKMNVAQMLSHMQAPVEVGLGTKQLKRTLIGFLFGGIAKKQLFSERPFPQSLPTDASFIRKGEHDFETEKVKLVSLLNQLVAGGEEGLTKLPHPFFGKLTNEEWGTSLWKHFDHHLKQFGV